MKKILIRVDPDLIDLIPGFLDSKRNDARAILRATSAAGIDFNALSRIGHRLKGEGGSYGFDAISSYGAEIEAAAKRCDAGQIERCAGELAAYLDAVEIVC